MFWVIAVVNVEIASHCHNIMNIIFIISLDVSIYQLNIVLSSVIYQVNYDLPSWKKTIFHSSSKCIQ
jgi:hypothetical protein